MAHSFPFGAQHYQSSNSSHSAASSHNHHGGRSRRGQKLSSQNSHRQFRGGRSMKDLIEPIVPPSAFRSRFESGKGFDLDDDLEFCPNLLTEDDLQSIHSGSDRSSLSSGSPSSSPLQHQVQPAQQVSPSFSLTQVYQPATYNQTSHSQMKIHQPAALRTRNAIPIVNPSTGIRIPSPPESVSPARMQQQRYQRVWQ